MALYILLGSIDGHKYQRTFNVSPANYDYFTDSKNPLNSTGVRKFKADIKKQHKLKHGKSVGRKFSFKLVAKM